MRGIFYFFVVMLKYCAIVMSSDLESGCRATKTIKVTAKIKTIAKINVVNLKKFATIVSFQRRKRRFFGVVMPPPRMLDMRQRLLYKKQSVRWSVSRLEALVLRLPKEKSSVAACSTL